MRLLPSKLKSEALVRVDGTQNLRGSRVTRKNLRWRFLAILGVTVICILGSPASLAKVKDRIHLGLDQRGMHPILQVVTDDAVSIETDLAVERLRENLRSRQVAFSEVCKRDVKTIEIRDLDPQKTSEVRATIDEGSPIWDRWSLPGSTNSYVLTLKTTVERQIRVSSVQQRFKPFVTA